MAEPIVASEVLLRCRGWWLEEVCGLKVGCDVGFGDQDEG